MVTDTLFMPHTHLTPARNNDQALSAAVERILAAAELPGQPPVILAKSSEFSDLARLHLAKRRREVEGEEDLDDEEEEEDELDDEVDEDEDEDDEDFDDEDEEFDEEFQDDELDDDDDEIFYDDDDDE